VVNRIYRPFNIRICPMSRRLFRTIFRISTDEQHSHFVFIMVKQYVSSEVQTEILNVGVFFSYSEKDNSKLI
jgi:hypothetical protein